MGFAACNAAGKHGEGLVRQLLETLGTVTSPKGKESRWDLVLSYESGTKVTFEVKNDLYAARSGNLAIEFYNPKSGKPSGIESSEADVWVYLAAGGIYFTGRQKLRDYMARTTGRIITAGGDGNASMVLFPMAAILPAVFTQLLDPSDLESIITKCLT